MLSQDKYILKPFLREKFNSIIWKIEIDTENDLIAIETRDSENRTAYFSAFNFAIATCLFKEVTVEQSWTWGLDRVANGFIYLHSYVAEQSPEHKGIIALNKLGQIGWQQFNKTLHAVSKEGLIVYDPKLQPRWLDLLQPETGTILKSNIKNYQPAEREILVPDLIYDLSIHPQLPQNIFGPIYFLQYNLKNCYAYHIKESENYIQQLLITQEDSILLKENLTPPIQKLNPEAFFITRGNLFCIRDEKREIVSYLV
jgi:hypothetical protein